MARVLQHIVDAKSDTAMRHGAILAIAELLLAVTNLGKTLDPQMISQIRYMNPLSSLIPIPHSNPSFP
jgi:hypothetical protein